jgi:hypothetical protein
MSGIPRRRPGLRGMVAAATGFAALLGLAVSAAIGLGATSRSAVAPTNTAPPTISGTAQVGSDLTAANGTWNGTAPINYTYQWRRCDPTGGSCSDISGATNQKYTLASVDQGNTLRVVVTAMNADGSLSSTTVPTAVITAAAPPPSNNGCPAQTTGTAPISGISLPAQLQIVGFNVTSGPVNKQTQTFTLQVRVGSTCGVTIQGASVYVTAVPYNQFDIPAEVLTGTDGTASLSFHRLSGFPASGRQQLLTLFVRATKPGENILAGVSARRLVSVNFSG